MAQLVVFFKKYSKCVESTNAVLRVVHIYWEIIRLRDDENLSSRLVGYTISVDWGVLDTYAHDAAE
jgi:hypothetical protein